jgi:hypothetical protein
MWPQRGHFAVSRQRHAISSCIDLLRTSHGDVSRPILVSGELVGLVLLDWVFGGLSCGARFRLPILNFLEVWFVATFDQ